MDCHDVLKHAHLLIDGEIQGSEKQILLEHLEKCRQCMEVVEAREKLKALVREKFQRKAACESLQKAVLEYVEKKA